ncbi:oligopeptide:H+ symporter [Apilactobacillus apisilvae]|uniref:Oligopeptide:H+ symporter n=1 Tax=Apilactobacillus apisilvae TaxID=2923364 RepID=A0ABY4PHQ1_9LACO|nr:oligopeptide:H+ symporter [Apilactobacillus apisilvae]UQS85018.1 oligopeptide:H+ symporter [Apilactobacillus apisilvae]
MKKKYKFLDETFNNQPNGLSTLISTETFERFTYYGTRATLLFYMYYSLKEGGIGLNLANAISIFSIFGSLVYLFSVLGGYVSDRLLGNYRTVSLGAILIIIGQLLLSLPLFKIPLLFISIIFLIFGTGLLKTTISSIVGNLYENKESMMDSGFTYYLSGVNLGALLAPMIIGFIGTHINFHLGFLVGAISMIIGFINYKANSYKYYNSKNMYPINPIEPNDLKNLFIRIIIGVFGITLITILMFEIGSFNINNIITMISIFILIVPILYFIFMFFSRKVNDIEKSNLSIYSFFFISATIFWIIEEQGPTIFAVIANLNSDNNFSLNKYILIIILFIIMSIFILLLRSRKNINKITIFFSIAFIFLSILIYCFKSIDIHIPSSWYQSLNPLFILIYTPLFAKLWSKFKCSAFLKYSIGLFFAGIGCFIMIIPTLLIPSINMKPMWLLLSIGFIGIGEMLISPIGMSLTNKLMPKAFGSQMMAISYLPYASAQAINSQISKYYMLNPHMYFIILGCIGMTMSCIFILFLKKFKKI